MKKSVKISIIAIVIMLIGGGLFTRNVVYPLKFKDDIVKYSKEYKVDPYVVASVINIESRFGEGFKYEKGRKTGVMQITDVTAEKWAKEMGIKNFDPTTIGNTSVNIQLGTWYLGKAWNEKNSSIKSIVERWIVRNNDNKNSDSVDRYEKDVTKSKGMYKILYPGLDK